MIGLFLSLSLTATPVAPACSPQDAANAVDDLMQAFAADAGAGAVVLAHDDSLLLSEGYGLANRATSTLFTADTIAQIGSLTKQFTATAILLLDHRGALSLGDTVGALVPDASGPVRSVTVRQLLTHAGGLPEYCGEDFTPQSEEGLLDCLSGDLLFEPGGDTAYSNPGYSLLALIVERVSGQSLEDFLQSEILQPNGLTDTGFFLGSGDAESLAHGYLDGEDRGVISERLEAMDGQWWNLKGNGGMQASSMDMYRWYRALNGDGALPPDVVDRLRQPVRPFEDGVAEGYGWYFRDDGTGEVRQMSHSGSDGVFFSYYWDRPEDGVFLYFTGSTGEDEVLEVLRPVLGILRQTFVEGCRG